MATAKVYNPGFSIFSPPPVVPGGWSEEFGVMFIGLDVPNGFAVDVLVVEFLDSDNAATMSGKIKTAAIAKGQTRGLTVPSNAVISYSAPSKL